MSRRHLRRAAGLFAAALLLWFGLRSPDSPTPGPVARASDDHPARVRRVRTHDRVDRRALERRLDLLRGPPELVPLAVPFDGFDDTGAPEDEKPRPALLEVTVLDDNGEPVPDAALFSPDCPTWSETDDDGVARMFLSEEGCRVQARRRDGLLYARSDWADVQGEPAEVMELELFLPTERTGGLGVQIASDPRGVRVMGVMVDTPAWDAGLEAGDIIVGVEGEYTDTLEMDAFIALATGPEGSEVTLLLAPLGDTGVDLEEITLERSFLEPPRVD